MEYTRLAHLYDAWTDYPGYPLEPSFTKEEYDLRVRRARERMAREGLDALVITSSAVGQWFTSFLEPHEWHDRCGSRSAWYILTPTEDALYMTPTAGGEHFNTTRRSTWVTHIRAIVERAPWPRCEIWDIAQMQDIFAELGLSRGRLGFELGDCMTLGLSVNDFLRLRDLLPEAQLIDGSPVIRHLMSLHTPDEVERTRRACQAGVWMHNRVPEILRPGLTERELFARLTEVFRQQFGAGYDYRPEGGWDVRNPATGDANFYHLAVTDRVYKSGDLICRGTSGVSYRGYPGDVDRVWYLGDPPQIVRHWYRTAWECNRAMAEEITPGARCSDIYAACARVEARNGLPERLVGRVGHGIRNTGCLSVHPDNHTVLEPGMIISVEPMFGNEYGWYDLEDQYLVTETGREPLNDLAPEVMPIIPA